MEHMHVPLYDVVLFPPVAENQETNPWRTLSRSDDTFDMWLCDFRPLEEGVNPSPGSTLKPARSSAICDMWEENNCSTGSWRLVSVRKHTTL